MAGPYTGPDAAAVHDALTQLVADGLRPYNVAENGGVLLELRTVEHELVDLQMPPTANDDERDAAHANALTAVLAKAVGKMGRHAKYRRLLEHLLPLKPELLSKPIEERRISGGLAMTEGAKTVKAGTVRTYHQPKALSILAILLIEAESKARGEEAPTGDQRHIPGVSPQSPPYGAGEPEDGKAAPLLGVEADAAGSKA